MAGQDRPLAALAPANASLTLLDLRLLDQQDKTAGNRRNALLAADEAQVLAGFANPKRRLEWLGGRLAGKHALCTLLGQNNMPDCFSQYAILADDHGRPGLAGPGPLPDQTQISLSHSRDYAAALATHTAPCGLDIQHLTPRLLKVRQRFAHHQELRLLDTIDGELLRLGLLWTAKEAVKKAFLADQPASFEAIRLLAIQRHTTLPPIWIARCVVQETTVAQVRLTFFPDYCLACTTEAAHA